MEQSTFAVMAPCSCASGTTTRSSLFQAIAKPTLQPEVRRHVKGQPVNNVQQPDLIHAYNQGMGGVDLMDRMVASYRPSIRGKKWHWPLFTNALNVTVVAAWWIHCKIAESPMSHLDFRRENALCLLKMSMVSRLQVGGGPRVNLVMMSGLMEKTITKWRLPKADARSAEKIAVTCVQSATCGCTTTASQNAMSTTTCEVDSLNNSLKS